MDGDLLTLTIIIFCHMVQQSHFSEGTTDLAVTWTADDWAELYVNGEFIVDVRFWGLTATHIIQPGTQVLAFKIGDGGGGFWFTASLNDASDSSTADITDWKCTGDGSSFIGLDWTYSGFDDSSWSTAVFRDHVLGGPSGISPTARRIWTGYNERPIWCRYGLQHYWSPSFVYGDAQDMASLSDHNDSSCTAALPGNTPELSVCSPMPTQLLLQYDMVTRFAKVLYGGGSCRDDTFVYSSTDEVLSCEPGNSRATQWHYNVCMLTNEQYNKTSSLSECEFDCGLDSQHVFVAFSYYMQNVIVCTVELY